MNEEKVKKPYRNYIWFLLAVTVVFAFVVIRTLFQDSNDFFQGRDQTIFAISALFGGLIAFTIIYQLGKALFALFSGFKIVSLNILVLTINKQENKWKFAFVFPEGFGGMVHVVPKNEYKKCHPILFHFGGVITSLFVAALVSIIFYFVDPTRKLTYISLIFSLVGIIILIINLLPLYIDGINDGFAIRLLMNPNNKKPYLDNLLQYAALHFQYGKIDLYEYERYDDTFQANSLIYQYYYYMDNEDFENAEKTCLKLLEYRNFVFHEVVCLSEVNKLYFYLLKESDNKCYDYYYSLDKEYRNYALSTSNFETLKTGILLACKVEKTYDVYEHLLKSENKTKATYFRVRLDKEEKLVAKSKKITISVFSDWEN